MPKYGFCSAYMLPLCPSFKILKLLNRSYFRAAIFGLMNQPSATYLSPYFDLLIFGLGGLGFVLLSLFVSKLIRPKRPNAEKNSSYESGEDAIGNSWPQINSRFYVLALIFLLFTHSIGDGSFAGLYQKNSSANFQPCSSHILISKR